MVRHGLSSGQALMTGAAPEIAPRNRLGFLSPKSQPYKAVRDLVESRARAVTILARPPRHAKAT
jgi:hypothetical protein